MATETPSITSFNSHFRGKKEENGLFSCVSLFRGIKIFPEVFFPLDFSQFPLVETKVMLIPHCMEN
jgi:hypothetical protein